MKRFMHTIIWLSTLSLASTALAGGITSKDTTTSPSKTSYWDIGAGTSIDTLSFGSRSNSLINNVASNPADTFIVDDISKVENGFHLRAGYDWKLGPKTPDNDRVFQLALEYNYFTQAEVSGTRTPINNTTFNSKYSYAIDRQAILLLAKADLTQWGDIMPYLQAGAGMSRNKFSEFSDPNSAVPMVPFPSNSTYQLAAIAGAGFDIIAGDLAIDMGYRFGYWGNLESGNVSTVVAGTALPGPIHLSHKLYSNAAIFTLSYRVA